MDSESFEDSHHRIKARHLVTQAKHKIARSVVPDTTTNLWDKNQIPQSFRSEALVTLIRLYFFWLLASRASLPGEWPEVEIVVRSFLMDRGCSRRHWSLLFFSLSASLEAELLCFDPYCVVAVHHDRGEREVLVNPEALGWDDVVLDGSHITLQSLEPDTIAPDHLIE